jgi:hypothetical protein
MNRVGDAIDQSSSIAVGRLNFRVDLMIPVRWS